MNKAHVHIVEPYHSAAMQRVSDPLMEWASLNFERMTIGAEPDNEADLNYHMPWHTLVGMGETRSKQGIYYTHLNPSARPDLIWAVQRADFIVAMSKTGRQELIDLGADPDKINVIYAGHSNYPPRRKNVGIIGYEQPNGRKRGHILVDLCWKMDVTPFQFVFCGGGWDDTITKMSNAGAAIANLGNKTEQELQDVYGVLDLLLVTSYVEGGPLTVMEAMSAGVPVIAPPVGYAADLLPDDCIYHTVEGLVAALENFIAPTFERRAAVEQFTWKRYADEHAALFERVLCQPTPTLTETAMSAPSYTE